MVERVDRFIYNLEGTLHHKQKPLLYFKIVNRKLIDWDALGWYPVNDGKPNGIVLFKLMDVNYASINEFFRGRVIDDGAYGCKEYLSSLGLKEYDFEKIIKASCGWNPVDSIWLKFDGGLFQKYEDILKRLK